MECYLSFSVKAEEMTIFCLGIASCLNSQTHLKKIPSIFFAFLWNRSKICELIPNYPSQGAAHSLS